MRTEAGFKCNVCGEPKRETNHWWKGYLINWDTMERPAGIMIVQWHVAVERETDIHLCGEACATKKLSEVMTKPAGETNVPLPETA